MVATGTQPTKLSKLTASNNTKPDKPSRPTPFAVSAKRFVYHDGHVFGRTCISWFKSIIYLTILYAVLVLAICYPMIIGLKKTLENKPRYYGPGSFMGGHPVAMFEPNPARKGRLLLWWNTDRTDSYRPFALELRNIIETQYMRNGTNRNCSDPHSTRNIIDGRFTKTSCSLDPTDSNPDTGYGPCRYCAENDTCCDNTYGFKTGEPCVMLRLNKMLGYYPKKIENYSHSSIPEGVREMYSNFTNSLNAKEQQCPTHSSSNCYFHRLFFSCRPEFENEDHKVAIDYYPKYGIPFCYYPYWRQEPYKAPFIMARFSKLQPGKMFTFLCGPYTSDSLEQLKHSMTRIHLMVDTKGFTTAEKYL